MWQHAQIMEILKYVLTTSIVFDVIVVSWILLTKKVQTKKLSSFYIFFVTLVIFEIFFWMEEFLVASENVLMLVNRLSFSIGAMTIFLLLYFLWKLVGEKYFSKKVMFVIFLICAGMSVAALIPNLMIKSRQYNSALPYDYYYDAGPLLIWFYILLGPLLFLILYIFIKGCRDAEGIQKIRLRIVGLGLSLIALMGIIAFLWLPLIFYFFEGQFYFSGSKVGEIIQMFTGISISCFSIMSAYAITRYRFLDIRVVLKKSFIYGAAIFISAGIVIGTAILLAEEFNVKIVVSVIIVLILAFQNSYKKWLKQKLDHLFFYNELDLSKAISEAERKLSTTHDLETFVFDLVVGVQKIVKAAVQKVLILERKHNQFTSYFPKTLKYAIHSDNQFLQDLLQFNSLVIADELLEKQTNDGNSLEKRVLELLKKQKSGLLMVLKNEKVIIGMVFVGEKSVGGPYNTTEIRNFKKLLKSYGSCLPSLIYWHETLERLKLRLHEDAYKYGE